MEDTVVTKITSFCLKAAAAFIILIFAMMSACYAETITADFNALFAGGAQLNEDETLAIWTPVSSAAGHRFTYQLTYNIHLPNGSVIKPGDLTFTIPKSLWTNRNGERGDGYEMSIPTQHEAETEPQNIDPEVFLAFREEGDNIVIYNFENLSHADYTGYVQIAYFTENTTFNYVDYTPGQSVEPYYTTMKYTAYYEGKEFTGEKQLHAAPVVMDSTARVISTDKGYPVMTKQWLDAWGTPPASAADCWYLAWPVTTAIDGATTQPYHLTLTDTLGTIVDKDGQHVCDMTICGYLFSGGKFVQASTDNSVTVSNQTLTQNRMDSVITMIPAAAVRHLELWTATNRIEVTLEPIDGMDLSQTVYDTVEYTYHKPDFWEPDGNYNAWKRGDGAYRDGDLWQLTRGGPALFNSFGFEAAEYTRYDLQDFQSGKLDTFGGFDYAVWSFSTANNLYKDMEVWENLPDQKYLTAKQAEQLFKRLRSRYVLVDNAPDGTDGVKLFKVDSGLKLEEGLELTPEDFQFVSLQYNVLPYTDYFDEDSQTFYALKTSLSASDVLSFYTRSGSDEEYVLAAKVSLDPVMPKVESLAEGVWVDLATHTVHLPEGTTAYKVETENEYFEFLFGVVAKLELKNSVRVLNYIKGANQIAILNQMRGLLYRQDPETKEYTLFRLSDWREEYDYARSSIRESSLSKNVVAGRNDVLQRRFIVSWNVQQIETIRSGEDNTVENLEQYTGTFYDLLPLGATLDEKSIAVRVGSEYLSSNYYTVTQHANYRDHRTLLVVKIHDSAPSYALSYDTFHAWDTIKDIGNAVDNIVAYQTGNADIAKGYPDDGGSLPANRRPLISGLDPTSEGNRFLYAQARYDINAITSASTGLSKRVKAVEDEQYGNETTVLAGGDYIYRLRFASDPSVSYTNMIFFDALEQDTHNGAVSEWYGRLTEVDTSDLVIMGIAPKVYYTTQAVALPAEGVENYVFDASVWTQSQDNASIPEAAYAVAVDMRKDVNGNDFRLAEGESVYVNLFMKAPDKLPDSSATKNVYPETYNGVEFLGKRCIIETGATSNECRSIGPTIVRYVVVSDVPVNKQSSVDAGITIPGVTFRLYGTSDYGTAVDMMQETDKRGNTIFRDLEKGSYTLLEYATTPDWLLNTTQHSVVIDHTGNLTIDGVPYEPGVSFVMKNDPRIHGDLTFYKRARAAGDYAEAPIEGVSFRLSGISNYGSTVEMYATSDASGAVRFPNVEYGTNYTLEELTSSWTSESPYLPLGKTLSVSVNTYGAATIAEDDMVDLDGKAYNVWNKRRYLDFAFYKRDGASNQFLQGAQFRLTGNADSGAYYDITAVSDETGKVSFTGLERGTYLLKETKAPSLNGVNYQLDPNDHYVTIGEDGFVTITGMTYDDTLLSYVMDNMPANDNELIIYKKWVDNDTSKRVNPELTVWTGAVQPAGLGYSVTYVANGGTFGGKYSRNVVRYYTDSDGNQLSSGTYLQPEYLAYVDGTATPTAMTFIGWQDANGNAFDPNDAWKLAENKTVYAQWKLEKTYNCTNAVQTFSVPSEGWYKLQVWGGEGGNDNIKLGGPGGYSEGYIYLSEAQQLYVMVGGQGICGTATPGGWNGGGTSGSSGTSGSGGGMTHISLISNPVVHGEEWIPDATNTLIVAGGGGGAGWSSYQEGGFGGGLVAGHSLPFNTNSLYGRGGNTLEPDKGTQLRGNGADRVGGNRDGAGGGGGWYAGMAPTADNGAGGGSAYLNPMLKKALSIPGNDSMPEPNGNENTIGHTGPGAAKFTYISNYDPTAENAGN